MLKRLKRIKKEEKKSTGWWAVFIISVCVPVTFFGNSSNTTITWRARHTRMRNRTLVFQLLDSFYIWNTDYQISELPCSEILDILNLLILLVSSALPLIYPWMWKNTPLHLSHPQNWSFCQTSEIFLKNLIAINFHYLTSSFKSLKQRRQAPIH